MPTEDNAKPEHLHNVISSYQLTITVDHFQIFFQDSEYDLGDEEDLDIDAFLYSEDAFARHVGGLPRLLNIFTAKWYGVVRLEVVVCRYQPDDILTDWDNVAEVSIEAPSGSVLIYASESNVDERVRIAIPPDTYRARIYTGGIETVDENVTDGQDYYRVILWPSPFREPTMLHAGINHPW